MLSKLSATNYKHITATGLVLGSATEIYGITLAAGSDTATLTLYDWVNTTGGTILWKIKAGANTSQSIEFPHPLSAKTAVYAVLEGTGPVASIAIDGNFTTTSTSTSTTTTSTSTTTTSTSTTTTSTSTTT